MRAPTEKQADAELIDNIVRELKAPEMRKGVEESVLILRSILANKFLTPATEAVNTNYAKRGLAWLADAEKWLDEAMRAGFLDRLFLFTSDELPPDLPPAVADGSLFFESAMHFLGELRDHCEQMIKSGYGAHGNTNHASWQAAVVAQTLCKQADQPVTWWDENGVYRIVAGLLYQAMTGKEATGMERVCKTVAHFFTRPKFH